MPTEKITEHLTFQEELASALFAEAKPLLEAHWAELPQYPDLPLDPDWDAYVLMTDAGMLRTYTIRDHGDLKGYAVFYVKTAMHYRGSRQASQDILYLAPALRKQTLGARFIAWCDEQLRADGCQVVSHHVKPSHDFSPLLARLGYESMGAIWSRRLDAPGR